MSILLYKLHKKISFRTLRKAKYNTIIYLFEDINDKAINFIYKYLKLILTLGTQNKLTFFIPCNLRLLLSVGWPDLQPGTQHALCTILRETRSKIFWNEPKLFTPNCYLNKLDLLFMYPLSYRTQSITLATPPCGYILNVNSCHRNHKSNNIN